MWKDKLREIVSEKKMYDEKINFGATREEIQFLQKKLETELKVCLPDEFCKVLESINGLEFNGFILYGVDQYLLSEAPNQSINGLFECNKIWYENEWQKKYIFLGESNISWYVYDLYECIYCELDNPSGRKNEMFSEIDYMLEKMLSDALI